MRILWRVLVVIVLIAAILGIGVYAYNIGMAQGLAQKGSGPGGWFRPDALSCITGIPSSGLVLACLAAWSRCSCCS